MAITDAWMTWAARPDELALPVGLRRIQEPHPGVGFAHVDDVSPGDASAVSCDVATQHQTGDSCSLRMHITARQRSPADSRQAKQSSTASIKSRVHRRPTGRILGLIAASGVAAGGVLTAPGCETFLPVAIHAAISGCIALIKSLVDAPIDHLPMGYGPCESFEWNVEGHELKFCVFCDPAVPSEVLIQFQCTGKYYPMRLRRIEHATNHEEIDGISIKSIQCDEQFLINVQSTVDPFFAGVSCSVQLPNSRMLPSLEHYGTLDVRLDGTPAPRDGDFFVEGATIIQLDGSFDEVAHYAMTCGVVELAFKDNDGLWTVHSNPEVSAIAVLRNGELHDARFLFAPMPPGGFAN